MTEELPSDWHLAEALRRENPALDAMDITKQCGIVKLNTVARHSTIAHARTLAEFIPEPVDPLLVMAREICAKVAVALGHASLAERYRNGDLGNSPSVQFALECLRKAARGVE